MKRERNAQVLAGGVDNVDYDYSRIVSLCVWHLLFSRGFHICISLWKSWKEIDNVAAHRGTREVLCN